mmetsp:Transcript_23785/g.51945  ORF Transcript_23785/g.51945 Transcript_23785/m.51945 type:complete len:320 (-) Transcript_23785:156-1115(-)
MNDKKSYEPAPLEVHSMSSSYSFSGSCRLLWVLLCTVLLAAGEELKSVKDTIFATKSHEVMALGLFYSNKDPGYEEFKVVSNAFSSEAVFMAYSFSKEIHERYAEETKGRLPALIVFRSFDEDGQPKRGKRVKLVFEEDEFSRDALAPFVFQAALPPVLPMPASGPDSQARLTLAMRSKYPKMMIFSKEREVGETMLATAKLNAHRMVSILVTVDDNEDTGGILSSAFPEPRAVSARDTIRAGSTIVVLMDPVTGGRREAEEPTSAELGELVTAYLAYVGLKDEGTRMPVDLKLPSKGKQKTKKKKKTANKRSGSGDEL